MILQNAEIKAASPNLTRIDELDSLRGIAAIAVSFAHFHVGSKLINQIGVYAQHGVELFFLISGFVIFMTLQKKQTVLDFLVARFARLYPAYIISVGLIALLFLLFPAYLPQAPATKTFLGNCMIWHQLFNIDSVTVVYWTLWVEIRFYALMLIVLIFRQVNRIERFLWIWLLFVCGYEAIQVLVFGNKSKIPVASFIYALAIPGFVHYFVAGIVFYKMFTKKSNKDHFILLGACLARELYLFSPHTTPIVLCCYILFFLLIYGKLRFLRLKPFLFLGKISYSLYLTHQILGNLTIKILSMHTFISPGVKFLITEVVTIGVATIICYLIEYPAMGIIKRYYALLGSKFLNSPVKSSSVY